MSVCLLLILPFCVYRALCNRLHKIDGYKKKDIPQLPKRKVIGNLSQKTIRERTEKLNQFLNAAVKAEHLQWGIKVDDSFSAYKRRVKKQGSRIEGKGVEQSSHECNDLMKNQPEDVRLFDDIYIL